MVFTAGRVNRRKRLFITGDGFIQLTAHSLQRGPDMEKLRRASSPECVTPDDADYDQREAQILHGLLDHMEGVRQDVDLHVAANLIKIMAMAKVNRESLHTDALDRTLERIYELLFSLIFKEDA